LNIKNPDYVNGEVNAMIIEPISLFGHIDYIAPENPKVAQGKWQSRNAKVKRP
jgi:hypothetical protein